MADSAKRDCESYRIEFVRAAPKLHGKELLNPPDRGHTLLPRRGKTWFSLQPTEAERMDPRVVATSDDEVVVLWHQRGRSPASDAFCLRFLRQVSFVSAVRFRHPQRAFQNQPQRICELPEGFLVFDSERLAAILV
jgi:hypothetical protein